MSAMSHGRETEMTGNGPEFIRSQINEIDRSLMEAMAQDARLQSGVSQNRFTDDLDFIQMTGLTRAPAMPSPPGQPARQAKTPEADMNPARPVFFYEAGMTDVDQASAPEEQVQMKKKPSDTAPADPFGEESGPSIALTRTLETLRELVTELARDLGQSPRVQGDEINAAWKHQQHTKSSRPQEDAATVSSRGRHADAPSQSGPPVLTNTATPPFGGNVLVHGNAQGFDTATEPQGEEEQCRGELPAPPADATHRLAEAEHLLYELENQPREFMEEEHWLFLEEEEGRGGGKSDACDPEEAQARRSRRHASPIRKRVLYSALMLGGFVLAVAGVLAFRDALWPSLRSPEQLMSAARAAMEQGHYEEAAQQFLVVARRHPEHPLSADAWFEAGVALKQSASVSGNAARTRREEALSVLNAFVRDHPTDARRLRAECLIGVLYFELGNYPMAVDTLRAPAGLIEDPATALQVLRSLAAAHRMMGEYAAAESAYLQAAQLARNDSADTDYIDLGDMCLERARLAENAPDRQRLLQNAMEYWNRALQSSGGDPARRAQIHKRIDLVRGDLEASGGISNGLEDLTP